MSVSIGTLWISSKTLLRFVRNAGLDQALAEQLIDCEQTVYGRGFIV